MVMTYNGDTMHEQTLIRVLINVVNNEEEKGRLFK